MPVTQEMLDEARKAYHLLLTGGSVAEFRDQNGEMVRYSAANRWALANYIQWLEGQLGLGVLSKGPMRVWF